MWKNSNIFDSLSLFLLTDQWADKYCIAGNFRGRKLSQISKFCGYLRKFSLRNWGQSIIWQHQRAIREIFSAENLFSTNSWKFSPTKVSRYMVPLHDSIKGRNIVLLWCLLQRNIYHGCYCVCYNLASSSGDLLVELPKMQQGNSNYVIYKTWVAPDQ